MGFNAGGTNVNGVASVEGGVLTLVKQNYSITGDGTRDNAYTVPAGYVAKIKGVNSYKTSGTYTIDSTTYVVNDGTNTFTMGAALANLKESIFVPAGWTIRARHVISGWSVAGDVTFELLVQLAPKP